MRTKVVSIRQLQQNLKRVLEGVERGQIVDVTRRRRRVARLTPLVPEGPSEPWPDLNARARRIFGDRVVVPGAAETLIDERGDR